MNFTFKTSQIHIQLLIAILHCNSDASHSVSSPKVVCLFVCFRASSRNGISRSVSFHFASRFLFSSRRSEGRVCFNFDLQIKHVRIGACASTLTAERNHWRIKNWSWRKHIVIGKLEPRSQPKRDLLKVDERGTGVGGFRRTQHPPAVIMNYNRSSRHRRSLVRSANSTKNT